MLRPRAILEAFGRRYPGAWDALSVIRAAETETWPRHCFIPTDRAAPALPRTPGQKPDLRALVAFPGLAAWRATQQVYRFDPALYAALIATPVTGAIPGDVLRRLPAWCVYLELADVFLPTRDGSQVAIPGCFAWLDWWDGADMLCIGWDAGTLAVSHIKLGGTLESGLDAISREWAVAKTRGLVQEGPSGWKEVARQALPPVLSLLLYLCADEPDYTRPDWPAPRRIKGRSRLVPPERVTVVPVGERIGAALRRAATAKDSSAVGADGGGRASPIGHYRSAHWHTVLSGPRDQERHRELRWFPPIAVNLELDAQPVATVRPVR